jgi:hypothetical protein
MSRCGLVLAAILAASPVSAANVTTWANATGWANLVDCHKCADRYGVLARNLSECPAEWPDGAHTAVTNPHAFVSATLPDGTNLQDEPALRALIAESAVSR